MTVLGAGLLCGTALAVIIPEGVHALYEEVLEGEAFSLSSCHHTIDNKILLSFYCKFCFVSQL